MGGVASNRVLSSSSPKSWRDEIYKVTCTVEKERITDLSVLKSGDTIGVPTGSSESSSSGIPGFLHLGIYLEPVKSSFGQVIDYMNDSIVRKTDIRAFTEEGKLTLYRIHYIDEQPPKKPAQEIIVTADVAFKTQNFGEYNCVTNNCEHFATYCTFGRRFSYQVANVSVFGAM